MTESGQPIVIDNGTGVLKAGFAGGERPSCVFPSCVGRTKHPRTMISSNSKLGGGSSGKGKVTQQDKAGGVFVGAEAMEHRGVMRLRYPMRHGSGSRGGGERERTLVAAGRSRGSRDSPTSRLVPPPLPPPTPFITSHWAPPPPLLFSRLRPPALPPPPSSLPTQSSRTGTTWSRSGHTSTPAAA